tara:strand:+ start:523 stop:723 length:201 start_codon:yes stop_codon:yes gene_type:complete
MSNTVYHFYAKDECIVHNVPSEDFQVTWTTLKAMVGLMQTSYTEEDLSYIKLPEKKEEDILGDDSY